MEKTERYPLQCSPFFGLRSRGKLADLLQVGQSYFSDLIDDRNYHVFRIVSGSKMREVQYPVGKVQAVHKKVCSLLKRIQTPEYLFSGKKGVSYIDNARFHLDNDYFLITDIKSFYPRSKSEFVKRFFLYKMQTSPDVAALMSDILTYNGFIPTGSHVSQVLAYWTFSSVFDAIASLALDNGCKFSLYVDDMVFSSKQPIPKFLPRRIRCHLKRVEHDIKRGKVKFRSKGEYKLVTGCVITPDHKLRVRNRARKRIIDGIAKLSNSGSTLDAISRSLLGSISSTQQIEPHIFSQTQRRIRLIRK